MEAVVEMNMVLVSVIRSWSENRRKIPTSGCAECLQQDAIDLRAGAAIPYGQRLAVLDAKPSDVDGVTLGVFADFLTRLIITCAADKARRRLDCRQFGAHIGQRQRRSNITNPNRELSSEKASHDGLTFHQHISEGRRDGIQFDSALDLATFLGAVPEHLKLDARGSQVG